MDDSTNYGDASICTARNRAGVRTTKALNRQTGREQKHEVDTQDFGFTMGARAEDARPPHGIPFIDVCKRNDIRVELRGGRMLVLRLRFQLSIVYHCLQCMP